MMLLLLSKTPFASMFAVSLALAADSAQAYKIGPKLNLNAMTQWERTVVERFIGEEPVHEAMAEASMTMAIAHSTSTKELCYVTEDEVRHFWSHVPNSMLSISNCCDDRVHCGFISQEVARHPVVDENPLYTGVRWNDDMCHMLAGGSLHKAQAWLRWAGDIWSRRTVVKMSHNGAFQFLHAMATNYEEDAEATRDKMLMWSEFSFFVAAGHINSSISLAEVPKYLSPRSGGLFTSVFLAPGRYYGRWNVARLFSGLDHESDLHVRQIATGSLLHLIQDSFSDAHAHRLGQVDEKKVRAGAVLNYGPIQYFGIYRDQDKYSHSTADALPDGWNLADPPVMHPVKAGAQVIACSASAHGSPVTRWEKLQIILEHLFAVDHADAPPSPGVYKRRDPSTAFGGD